MRKIIAFIFTIIALAACVKNDNLNSTSQSFLEGQVISYTTGAPLSGAQITTRKCSQYDWLLGSCATWNSETTISDANGNFRWKNDYNLYSVSSNGYWSSQSNLSNNGNLTKTVVKLIPQIKVRVEIKNVTVINDSLPLYFIANFIELNRSANQVYLRKGIDTTFEYTAFEGVENRFTVKKGYNLFYPDSTLYSANFFLSAGSGYTLVIDF